MITKKDRQNLIHDFKQVFATKDDLKQMATKDDLKPFATKSDLVSQLSPIKKDLKSIKKDVRQLKTDVESTLKYTDEQDKMLKFRTKRVEKHLGLPEIPYIAT